MDLEAEASKKGKLSLSGDSESDGDATPEWCPRPKPLPDRKYLKIPYIYLILCFVVLIH